MDVAPDSTHDHPEHSYSEDCSLKDCHLELEIQELVLVGVAVHDRVAFQESVAIALQQLFLQQGIPPALTQATHQPQRDGSEIVLTGNPDPFASDSLAHQIAQSIYRGLGG
jgi:hypothetical protein